MQRWCRVSCVQGNVDIERPRVWTCDCCSSWTDRPVTRAELLVEWYWEESEDDEGVFCPECQ